MEIDINTNSIQNNDRLWLIGLCMALLLTIFLHHRFHKSVIQLEHESASRMKEIRTLNQALSVDTHSLRTKPKISNLPSISKFLKKLADTVPIGLYLTQLTTTSKHWILKGSAQNIDLVATWRYQLNQKPFQAGLQSLQFDSKKSDFPIHFQMEVKPHAPEVDSESSTRPVPLRPTSRGLSAGSIKYF